ECRQFDGSDCAPRGGQQRIRRHHPVPRGERGEVGREGQRRANAAGVGRGCVSRDTSGETATNVDRTHTVVDGSSPGGATMSLPIACLASGFSRVASGFSRVASGFNRVASGFSRVASGFSRVASGFSRKINAGSLPPKGGSHKFFGLV